MTSLSLRANAVFSFFTTVVFAVLAATAVTGPLMLSQANPSANIAVKSVSVKMGKLGYYYDYQQTMTELATIHFDLDADLTPLWNWNTKQLFVYVVAEYKTGTHIVIWDDIIRTKEDALISLRRQSPEYLASDITKKIRGVNATLSLHWDITPHVGLLMIDSTGSAPLRF